MDFRLLLLPQLGGSILQRLLLCLLLLKEGLVLRSGESKDTTATNRGSMKPTQEKKGNAGRQGKSGDPPPRSRTSSEYSLAPTFADFSGLACRLKHGTNAHTLVSKQLYGPRSLSKTGYITTIHTFPPSFCKQTNMEQDHAATSAV